MMSDRLPDVFRGEIGTGRRGVTSVFGIQFKVWIAFFVIPPVLTDGSNERPDLGGNRLVRLVHARLHFRFVLPGPCFVNHGNAPAFAYHFVQGNGGVPEFLYRAERVGVLLKDDIIVLAVQEIESHIRLSNVLREKPAAVRDHEDAAVDAPLYRPPPDHEGHIVVVCMAVPDK